MTDFIDSTNPTTSANTEQLLDEDEFRFTMKPINPKYEILWKLYKNVEKEGIVQVLS